MDRKTRPGSGTFQNTGDGGGSCLWAGPARNWGAWLIAWLLGDFGIFFFF